MSEHREDAHQRRLRRLAGMWARVAPGPTLAEVEQWADAIEPDSAASLSAENMVENSWQPEGGVPDSRPCMCHWLTEREAKRMWDYAPPPWVKYVRRDGTFGRDDDGPPPGAVFVPDDEQAALEALAAACAAADNMESP